MHIQQIANTMTRTVIIIHADLPQRFSCQIIQIITFASVQETRTCEIQIAPKYQCKEFLLLLCQLTQYKRTCDICCSLQILAACIHQK